MKAQRLQRFKESLRLCVWLALATGLAVMLLGRGSSAHDPITTNVRFTKEVVRILARNCLSCHRPDGIAPMSLATYEEARPWAVAIKEMVLERHMPSWHAVKGYGEFANAPQLAQSAVDTLTNWVEGGTPKGEAKDLPAEPLYSDGWSLGRPNLILKPNHAYRVAADVDERCEFLLPTGLKEPHWLKAIDLLPGTRSVVHCVDFYLSTSKEQRAKKESLHGHSAGGTLLGTWLPGQRIVMLPEGVALRLPARAKIRAIAHYRGKGEATEDLSTVGLYFAKAAQVDRALREVSMTASPAGTASGVASHAYKATYDLLSDGEAIAIRPVAHPLLLSLQAAAYRPDGTTEVLIWTRGHSFDWRPIYYFKEPVMLPKGTRVEAVAYFDNSERQISNPHALAAQSRVLDLTPDFLCSLLLTETLDGRLAMRNAAAHFR